MEYENEEIPHEFMGVVLEFLISIGAINGYGEIINAERYFDACYLLFGWEEQMLDLTDD